MTTQLSSSVAFSRRIHSKRRTSCSGESKPNSKDCDHELLIRAFDQHYHRLKRLIEYRMDRRLQGRLDAADIMQEVYLDAQTRFPRYCKQPSVSLFVWLRRLAIQRLVDLYRKHVKAERRRVTCERSLYRPCRDDSGSTSESMAERFVDRFASPTRLLLRKELVELLEGMLSQLDPIDREILSLRHFEELRNCEVAEVLGLKPAAASNRYVRAMTRLRAAASETPALNDFV